MARRFQLGRDLITHILKILHRLFCTQLLRLPCKVRQEEVKLSNNGCKLYLITPEIIEPNVFSTHLAAAIDAGNVACVQLRVKNASRDWLARTIEVLRPTVQDRDVAFILNDDPELAANTGCDGVHVGQSYTSYEKTRALVVNDAIVGVRVSTPLI